MDKEAIAKDVGAIGLVMQENSEFLLTNLGDSYSEVVGLIDDSWNFVISFVKRENWEHYYTQFSRVYFADHILMPLSFALRIDLLLGNIPACFFELRMILESMVKCFWADTRYREQDHFMEKLQCLEDENNRKNTSTSKLLEEMGHDYVALWGSLSKEWLHTEGFIRRILGETLSKSGIPAHALAIPMTYNETDIDIIKELHASVSKFRALLKDTINRWNF